MSTETLQLIGNTCLIQRESTIGDTGGDSTVVRARLSGSSIVRDIAATQERLGPFRTREYLDTIHNAWSVEIRGEVRSGGFLRWLIEHVTRANGTERSLDVLEFTHDSDPTTYALQFKAIDGAPATFSGAALQRLLIEFKGRRVCGYSATFAAIRKLTTEASWTQTDIEEGVPLSTSMGRLSLASDLGATPDANEVTGYEGSIEISRTELEPTQFSPDGIATRHSNARNWDVTGRLLLPEIAGITNTALSSRYQGEMNVRLGDGTAGTILEIHAGFTGIVDRRTGVANDWRQAQLDFVSRRASGEPVARIFTDQPTF